MTVDGVETHHFSGKEKSRGLRSVKKVRLTVFLHVKRPITINFFEKMQLEIALPIADFFNRIHLHFLFQIEELYCELNYHDQKIFKIIRYVSRVKRSNPKEEVVSFPTLRYCSYWKGGLRVTVDYSCQLYLLYIYVLWRYSQPGFYPSFGNLAYLATLMNSDRTKQSVCGWQYIYIYIYIYI